MVQIPTLRNLIRGRAACSILRLTCSINFTGTNRTVSNIDADTSLLVVIAGISLARWRQPISRGSGAPMNRFGARLATARQPISTVDLQHEQFTVAVAAPEEACSDGPDPSIRTRSDLCRSGRRQSRNQVSPDGYEGGVSKAAEYFHCKLMPCRKLIAFNQS